jgi:hypothetical protein
MRPQVHNESSVLEELPPQADSDPFPLGTVDFQAAQAFSLPTWDETKQMSCQMAQKPGGWRTFEQG